MSTPGIIKFVAQLQDLGVKLTLQAGELKVKAPKGVLQGDILEKLKAEKAAIQDYLLVLKASQNKSKSKIPRVSRNKKIPLSYGQQRLWFLHELNEGTAFYNMPMVLKVEGELDLERFEQSVQALTQRHEILRTNFVREGGHVYQKIHDHIDWHITIIDFPLNDPFNNASQQKLKQKISQLCSRRFDLAHDKLFQIILLKINDSLSYCISLMHHIIGDAWSTEVLVKDLMQIYLFGQESLPQLGIQYADYAAWQREWLSNDVLEEQLDFWREELEGTENLQLPFDRLRPKLESHRGSRIKLSIEKQAYGKLKKLAEQENVTVFMLLMAVYEVLLYRYSGQENFAVGTPIANRDKEELADQIGFFINTLAIRSDIDAQDSFSALLGKVKARLLNAYSHQDLPFEQIVDALKLERNTSHAPVFQTMLVLNSSSFATDTAQGIDTQAFGNSKLANLKIALMDNDQVNAKFDLNCELVESKDNLTGHFEYNSDLFDEETIQQLADHFQVLLNSVCDNPDSCVSSIELLSPEQRQALLAQSQGESCAYPAFANVSEFLSEALLEHGEREALVSEGHSLSYADLHARSEALAFHLQSLMTTAHQPVALCLERSVDMVVAILATIKLGSPYLPLDPELPLERLQFMLTDSGSPLLCVHGATASLFDGEADCKRVDISDENVYSQKGTLDVRAKQDDLFNIIYTSGSTGNPKGVMVTHGGILNRIQWMQSAYGLQADDRVLQKTTYSFDVSVWEFIWPLSQGACLVLASPQGHKDPAYLNTVMVDERISHCHFVPSMLSAWLAEGAQGPSLQKVFCSGEALSREAVNGFYEALPGSELHNLYGPTEAAIDVSYWHCEAGLGNECMVPIGRPVANTGLYVLDHQGALVPAGVAGELYIGGVQLARGYLNRDDLTEAAFVEVKLNGHQERLYKTGDRVRQRRDGVIDYLGRLDHQVKVRGYRIELGEIEARIQEVADVGLSVVVAAELQGSQHLVAYVTCTGELEESVLIERIRVHLQARLPAYMVPGVIMVLDVMPQLGNGKIDRKRLPQASYRAAEYVAPSSETELALAGIWSEVLQRDERIGLLDNFFELGGHSLLATRVLGSLREHLKKEVPLVKLFEYPQLGALANYVSGLDEGQGLQVIPLADRSKPLLLSPSQQRIWFLEQLTPGSSFYHMPAVARLTGRFDVKRFEASVAHMLARHDSLRTVFRSPEDGEEAVQVIEPMDDWQLDIMSMPDADRDSVKEKAASLLLTPFDLEQGPLFRMHLIQVSEQEHYLLAVMHHIISDGWSIEILLSDIVTCYLLGEQALAPLPIQYVDYAQWQRTAFGAVLEAQQAYWCAQLADVPVLQLPFDRLRPPQESHRGSVLPFSIEAQESAALKACCEESGATLFMSVMAVFQVLLSRYSGQLDFAVGTPVANRSHPQLERVIGCFINTLAIRAELSGEQSFRELLAQVKATSLDAFAHQDLPFEKLVDALKLERSLSHAPVFQVMLVVNKQALPPAELSDVDAGELRIDMLEGEHETAKFDLTLELSERDDRLAGHLEYNTDLFDRETIEQMLKHFKVLLRLLVDNQDAPIASLPLLDSAERQALLAQSQGESCAYPAFANVSEFLSEALLEHGEREALVSEGHSLSYADLHARSEALAFHLQSLMTTAHQPVALCLERSVDMVVAILATIKLGSPYLPLDPELPLERLQFMLTDSGSPLLCVHGATASLFDGEADCKRVDISDENVYSQKGTLDVRAKQDDLFNIIYTSGSTGNPKGVMVTHGGILNRIQWMQSAYGLQADDRVLQKTTYSFDVSVWEFIWPLSQGACLVLASPQGHKDPAYLNTVMVDERISHCHFVPSMLSAWLAEGAQGPSLQKVFCSGEALSREAVNGFYEALPGSELHNLYGPTEAAIDVSYWHCEAGLGNECMVPIGRPVANTGLYVLDHQGALVPAGVAGELYIGGVQLARGYLNRDDLTEAAFVEVKLNGHQERLYKTGDRVRQRRDGVIDYLGRLDHQVKVRGYRIELGEIEARIQEVADVGLSVVVAAELQGSQHLVAYVTCTGELEESVLIERIRVHLQARLPAYMVPGVIMVLDVMPQLGNGKIDRKRLPQASYRAAEYVAPSSETELALAGIWSEVLQRDERIGLLDNFFELGGHSLLATKAVSRINKQLQVTVPLLDFFNYPQLDLQAELIEALQWAQSTQEQTSPDTEDLQGDREEFEL